MTFETLTIIESLLVAERDRRRVALMSAAKAYHEEYSKPHPDKEKVQNCAALEQVATEARDEIIRALYDFQKTDWR